MFIPDFLTNTSQLISILTTIFWVWMLIDCIRNRGVRNKAGWILLILFLHFFGAIIYFFTRGPWHTIYKYLQQRGPAPIYQPPPAQPKQETYASYEQGYQPQQPEPAPAFQENEQPFYVPASSVTQPQYEQPQVPYPEEPPLQQF